MSEYENENNESNESNEEQNDDLQAQLDELKSKIEEKDSKIEEITTELNKEKDKDKNFAKLREKKEKIEEGKTGLEEEVRTLSESISKFQETSRTDLKNKIIKEFVGDDEDMFKKVDFHYGEFAGVPENEENIRERVIKSLKITGFDTSNNSGQASFSGGVNATGNAGKQTSDESFADTEDGKSLAQKLNLKQATIKKEDK